MTIGTLKYLTFKWKCSLLLITSCSFKLDLFCDLVLKIIDISMEIFPSFSHKLFFQDDLNKLLTLSNIIRINGSFGRLLHSGAWSFFIRCIFYFFFPGNESFREMCFREMSFREMSHSGKWVSGKWVIPGNVFPGNEFPGNDFPGNEVQSSEMLFFLV